MDVSPMLPLQPDAQWWLRQGPHEVAVPRTMACRHAVLNGC